jgi:hypothetical protein
MDNSVNNFFYKIWTNKVNPKFFLNEKGLIYKLFQNQWAWWILKDTNFLKSDHKVLWDKIKKLKGLKIWDGDSNN